MRGSRERGGETQEECPPPRHQALGRGWSVREELRGQTLCLLLFTSGGRRSPRVRATMMLLLLSALLQAAQRRFASPRGARQRMEKSRGPVPSGLKRTDAGQASDRAAQVSAPSFHRRGGLGSDPWARIPVAVAGLAIPHEELFCDLGRGRGGGTRWNIQLGNFFGWKKL